MLCLLLCGAAESNTIGVEFVAAVLCQQLGWDVDAQWSGSDYLDTGTANTCDTMPNKRPMVVLILSVVCETLYLQR